MSGEKCVILNFSNPVHVKNINNETLFGRKISITSFVNQKTHDEENFYYSSFNLKNQNYYQNRIDEMCKSDGSNEKIKLLSFFITKPVTSGEKKDLHNFVFGSQLLKQLYKQYESVLNPEKHLRKRLLENEYEI